GGALSVAVTYEGGVVMGTVSKAESPLVMDVGTRKIGWLTNGIAMAYSGLAADSRVLMRKSEACCLGYRGKFGENAVIPVGMLVADLAMTMQEYTQMGGVRPFGVALLVAGLDLDGVKLFRLDSAGSYSAWKAVAIGKGSAEAEEILHEKFEESMDRESALALVLDVVHRCSGGTRREDVETAFIETPRCRDLS
ncbi:unnamed protein product, partial [Hapterophycus canaliculatus]